MDANIANAVRKVSAEQLQATIKQLVGFGTRNTISPATPEEIKAGHGIGAAREWIKSQFQRYSQECGGCLEVKEDRFTEGPAPRIPLPTEIVNVYAVLRGTDPEAAKHIYLVSGHYDSRATDVQDVKTPAPGADDDGSGTAVVLETARVLSKQKFPGTIIFLAVAGEEQGLNGSKHFAKMAKDQGWNIDAVLNDDTVGGDQSPGQKNLLRVFAEGIPLADLQGAGDIKALRQIRGLGEENDSSSRELARHINAIQAAYNLPLSVAMICRPDRYLRGGDHTSFNEQGFAAVRLTEWRENYDRQHQNPRTENGLEYGDLPKFVDYEYLARVAQMNVAVLASLASAPPQPTNVRLLTKELTNDSTLTWTASPGAGSYEVVWRDTTSPVWQHARSFPGDKATIDESKDNVVFGVRAVSRDGKNRSLAVVPLPER
jgi:Zn-dependent M28 family amino/carboxypeptidase